FSCLFPVPQPPFTSPQLLSLSSLFSPIYTCLQLCNHSPVPTSTDHPLPLKPSHFPHFLAVLPVFHRLQDAWTLRVLLPEFHRLQDAWTLRVLLPEFHRLQDAWTLRVLLPVFHRLRDAWTLCPPCVSQAAGRLDSLSSLCFTGCRTPGLGGSLCEGPVTCPGPPPSFNCCRYSLLKRVQMMDGAQSAGSYSRMSCSLCSL
uniref:Uncharacterized protein n=1 Tax=Kryptolebias marmoratus TaxID=37003 RepID=A0A3Q3EKF4_KRYMA